MLKIEYLVQLDCADNEYDIVAGSRGLLIFQTDTFLHNPITVPTSVFKLLDILVSLRGLLIFWIDTLFTQPHNGADVVVSKLLGLHVSPTVLLTIQQGQYYSNSLSNYLSKYLYYSTRFNKLYAIVDIDQSQIYFGVIG